METALVSIIIPSHNYGHLIVNTLQCLQQQRYQHWEAIIIDDGSEDNTKDVVAAIEAEDSRFIYIYQENTGVAIARNNGLKQAMGKYIQFLDADDLITPEKIALQVEYMEMNQEVDLLLVNTRYFHSTLPGRWFTDLSLTNQSTRGKLSGAGLPLIMQLIKNNPIVVHAPLFKSNILKTIGHFAPHMDYLEDWDLWFRIALEGYYFEFLDHENALALVRVHSLSASQKDNKLLEGEGYFRQRIAAAVKANHTLGSLERIEALKFNESELLNTYKYLMANTTISNLAKFKEYYLQLQNPKIFVSSFIKSLNLKRKLITLRGSKIQLF